MDYNTIKALLDKYFAGETSLTEEEQLRTYFQDSTVHEDFRSYQALFGFFAQEKRQKTSPNFEERFESKQSTRKTSLRVVRVWSAAAAVVLLLTAAWYLYPDTGVVTTEPQASIDWEQYEPKTTAEAAEVTKGAFMRTSKAMYQSLNQAVSEVENVKKIMSWD